jgi:hypothetical protein
MTRTELVKVAATAEVAHERVINRTGCAAAPVAAGSTGRSVVLTALFDLSL